MVKVSVMPSCLRFELRLKSSRVLSHPLCFTHWPTFSIPLTRPLTTAVAQEACASAHGDCCALSGSTPREGPGTARRFRRERRHRNRRRRAHAAQVAERSGSQGPERRLWRRRQPKAPAGERPERRQSVARAPAASTKRAAPRFGAPERFVRLESAASGAPGLGCPRNGRAHLATARPPGLPPRSHPRSRREGARASGSASKHSICAFIDGKASRRSRARRGKAHHFHCGSSRSGGGGRSGSSRSGER